MLRAYRNEHELVIDPYSTVMPGLACLLALSWTGLGRTYHAEPISAYRDLLRHPDKR